MKGAAASVFTVDFQFQPQLLNQAIDNRQAKAAAAGVAFLSGSAALKGLEDGLLLLQRDAGPGIHNAQRQFPVGFGSPIPPATTSTPRGGELDLPSPRVPDGVYEQVRKQAPQSYAVGVCVPAACRRHIGDERQRFVLRRDSLFRGKISQERLQRQPSTIDQPEIMNRTTAPVQKLLGDAPRAVSRSADACEQLA